jgi:O-acetyl-ADP-ribose deacetylase (regulator of RNase III)
MAIVYLNGDATKPVGNSPKIITHIVNSIGAWGKGFVISISKRWKEPEREYRKWYKNKVDFELGKIQIVKVEENIYVANLIAQEGIYPKLGVPPIRYEAFRSALKLLQREAIKLKADIHCPRLGAGLAGGSWDKIEQIIIEELINNNIKVYVYDYKK